MIKISKKEVIKILPVSVKRKIKELWFRINLMQIRYRHHIALVRIRKSNKIKVAFFLIHEAVWKYEGIYRLMANDSRFDPIVVICPYTGHGEENMLRDMNQAYNSFLVNGYNVKRTYNEETKKWLDVKNEVKPDIVFFTNPHKLTKDEYYITNYLDCLTCYVPYAFVVIHLLQDHYNQSFHNFLWKAFYETEMHKKFAVKYAFNKGKNVIVTGYPGIDKLIDSKYIPKDIWKIKDRKLKRIIWAPHHTIDDDKSNLSYSNFIRYHQFMIDLAEKYYGKIQIAFKPHPILFEKLVQHEDWGKEKTEAYYLQWGNMKNGQLEVSSYDDLFLTSDAMIHDSASFMVEYLYTGKPVAFTVRDINIEDRFNDFGKMVYKHLYKLNNESDIIDFIERVVFQEQDSMKNERLAFLQRVLLPPGGQSASKNIFNEILKATYK